VNDIDVEDTAADSELSDKMEEVNQAAQPVDVSPDGPPVVDPLAAVVAAVRDLEASTRSFHQRAEHYEATIRQMQGRIEELRGDQVQVLLKPVIQRIAALHAQAAEAEATAHERGEAGEKDFGFFAVSIEEALGLLDIETVGAAVGGTFGPGHHAVRAVTTHDADLDGKVQRVLRQGFTYAGASRVLLPAQVAVYRFEEPAPPSSDQIPVRATTATEGATRE
jgi:molecular chaperone GrpE (heat shock protein)